MAEPAIGFLLGNLQQLLEHNAHLIKGAKDQLKMLESDVQDFKAFLMDSAKQRRDDERFRVLGRQIRDVIYEAEDIIDKYVIQAATAKTQNRLTRFFKTPVNLLGIANEVQSINLRSSELKRKLDAKDLEGPECPEEPDPEIPLVGKNEVVGFEANISNLRGYLKENKVELDVISIVGMPGLGKTTLARRIFDDDEIKEEFPTRIWIYVSQVLKERDIYLSIIGAFTRITEEIKQKHDTELVQIASEHLAETKFLIVMDDVWTPKDWDKITLALPRKCTSASKVLLTSRHREVAQHANHKRAPHELKRLNPDDSLLLFQYEVFGKPNCPPELAHLGNIIVSKCSGLPLAIVVIGGILARQYSPSDDIHVKRVAWEMMSSSVSTYLNEEGEGIQKIINLSYNKLPYHLKYCFLYMGMFPEDFEIPVWKLIRMWIAEGFIQEKGSLTLEETAEKYLNELINANLVSVESRRPDGRIKTCRIHNVLHDFCKNKAGSKEENFLRELKATPDESFTSENYRRICIHSKVSDFISSRLVGPHVRSFVSFSEEVTALQPENTTVIPTAFKLVRVLDIMPLQFADIPNNMYQLVHLRYIALSVNLEILPAAFAKLPKIETLIVDTSKLTLEIEADIWTMSQLRHLKTNVSTSLPKAGKKSGKEATMLEALGTISPQCCTEEVIGKALNLKKLSIRGELDPLIDGKAISFKTLLKLSNLDKLKLLNGVSPDLSPASQLHRLPPPDQFPPNLKSLTLSNTYLEWSQMSILGSLENLKVLKLKKNAFRGTTWVAKDGGFCQLEVLHIEHTNLTLWEASEHHYPKLRHLKLHYCPKLNRVPLKLADIQSFQMLDLYHSKDANTSAINILKAKEQKRLELNIQDTFKLSIFPNTVMLDSYFWQGAAGINA